MFYNKMCSDDQNSVPGEPIGIIGKILSKQGLFADFGLTMSMVQWCDVARSFNSMWGSNITDMTLMAKDGGQKMPVIRYPNFDDLVYTLPASKIAVVVGNEEVGGELRTITLKSYLEHYGALTPSIKDNKLSVFNQELDENRGVVVRVQAVPLPGDECEFVPTAYNYQTLDIKKPKNSIFVASHLGTSSQLDGPGTEPVYLHRTTPEGKVMGGYFKGTSQEVIEPEEEKQKGAFVGSKSAGVTTNVIMFGQVPLKQPPSKPLMPREEEYFDEHSCWDKPVYRSIEPARIDYGSSVMEYEGYEKEVVPERDVSQPITITICFYYCTDGNLTSADAKEISETIKKCYKDGEWAGSLVTHTDKPEMLAPDTEAKKRPHGSKSLDKGTMVSILRKVSSGSLDQFPVDDQ